MTAFNSVQPMVLRILERVPSVYWTRKFIGGGFTANMTMQKDLSIFNSQTVSESGFMFRSIKVLSLQG